MKTTLKVVFAALLAVGPAGAGTIDFTDSAFDTAFDDATPLVQTIDGVEFTFTPTARGADGFRQNAQGLFFGIGGNGMRTLSISADSDVTLTSLTGVDQSSPGRTTPGQFDALAGGLVAFGDLEVASTTPAVLDFADIDLTAGDSFTLIYDFVSRPGFNAVFASTTLSSIAFDVSGPTTPVPLPAGFPLLLAGVCALGIMRRRR